MKIIKILLLIYTIFFNSILHSNELTFNDWLKDFKIYALKNNISEDTFNRTMSNVIYLPKVIKYDRYQPESYEDTYT